VREGSPGVIAFGIGRERSGVVIECVRRTLINILIIDTDLATNLFADLQAS
jgi:hypothetical protein